MGLKLEPLVFEPLRFIYPLYYLLDASARLKLCGERRAGVTS